MLYITVCEHESDNPDNVKCYLERFQCYCFQCRIFSIHVLLSTVSWAELECPLVFSPKSEAPQKVRTEDTEWLEWSAGCWPLLGPREGKICRDFLQQELEGRVEDGESQSSPE